MTLTLVLVSIGMLLGAVVLAVVVGRVRFDRDARRSVASLLDAAESPSPAPVSVAERNDLPPPIRRYLNHVLPTRPRPVESLRLEQTGTFRSGSVRSPWSRFTATQHVTTHPPGFVWDATIRMVPALPVRVVDEYRAGRGSLRAKLAGLLPVADAPSSQQLDEGELLRYLAEAPLYPTVLLPNNGVRWTAVDESSARATLEHQGTTASLVFHVNEDDEVDQVSGRRAFLNDDGSSEYLPWTGHWWNYQVRDGMRVPTDGKVAWVRNEGEFCYWRGHMDDIRYRVADANARQANPVPSSSNRRTSHRARVEQ